MIEFRFLPNPPGQPVPFPVMLTRQEIYEAIAILPRSHRPAGTLTGRAVKLNKAQADAIITNVCTAYLLCEWQEPENLHVFDALQVRRGGEWVPLFAAALGVESTIEYLSNGGM